MSARRERKAYAMLGKHAPLHNWKPARQGWFCSVKGCGAKSSSVDDTRACLPRVPGEFMRLLNGSSKDMGNVLGNVRELRVFDMLLALKPSLPWVIEVRLGTKAEDKSGVDIVIATKRGTMFVQSKSGKQACRLWRKKYAATIGHKTVLVRWDGDRIVAPTNLREAIEETYMKLVSARDAEVSA